MNVKEIVLEYLKKHNFEGLVGNECCCEVKDLMPCDGLMTGASQTDCEPGYKCDCNPETCTVDGDCPFHISTEKPDKEVV